VSRQADLLCPEADSAWLLLLLLLLPPLLPSQRVAKH
jgi:hypothetical protein